MSILYLKLLWFILIIVDKTQSNNTTTANPNSNNNDGNDGDLGLILLYVGIGIIIFLILLLLFAFYKLYKKYDQMNKSAKLSGTKIKKRSKKKHNVKVFDSEIEYNNHQTKGGPNVVESNSNLYDNNSNNNNKTIQNNNNNLNKFQPIVSTNQKNNSGEGGGNVTKDDMNPIIRNKNEDEYDQKKEYLGDELIEGNDIDNNDNELIDGNYNNNNINSNNDLLNEDMDIDDDDDDDVLIGMNTPMGDIIKPKKVKSNDSINEGNETLVVHMTQNELNNIKQSI